MFSRSGHAIVRAVKALSWRGRVLAATVAVLILGAGAGVAGAAVAASPGIPTQGVRTGADVANWCIHYGSNKLVYDWNQQACPAGTYPLSFVSMPQMFTLTFNGMTENCTLMPTLSAGVESDAVSCTAPPAAGG